MFDNLIIGAGPGGITASIYLKRANLKIAIFESRVPGGQLVNYNEIENYTGSKNFSSIELATDMLEHAEKLNIDIIYEKVIRVEKNNKNFFEIITENNKYTSKSITIASGTVPRKLGVENEEELSYNGISWCAICDGPIYKGKDVVVIGGGNSAVEESQFLSTFVKSVTIIQNLDKFTAEAKAVNKLMNTKNVKVYFGSNVKKFIKDDKGEMDGVLFKDSDGVERTVKAEGVFEYIGMIPATNFMKKFDILDDYGFVVVNEKMETKEKGIFSCGDVNKKQIRQVVTATGDGAIAAQNVIKYLEEIK